MFLLHHPDGRVGVVDNSGIRLFLADTTGTEYAMRYAATFDINVPPNAESRAQLTCKATTDFHVFAAMPHMHEQGQAFSHILYRQDGTQETLIQVPTWDFHRQMFYEVGVIVHAGDELRLTCDYLNGTSRSIIGGLGTGDEMCFDFMYVTPPQAAMECLY